MQFRLLGPLEVICEGELQTPSAPKLRRVLALLAIHGNAVVRVDQLIDELWEDRPPPSATGTLQTYIYQLRKMLDLAEGDSGARGENTAALRTRSGGYSLQVPDEAVDVRCFETLVEQGRREYDSGSLEAAAESFRAALQLWRGEALGDVGTGPVLHAELVRLIEIRRSAMEHRIDVELMLGRHHQVIGELTGLAARQPTHEGFHAKLMVALHRSGRRSEALQAYQRVRSALTDELGLEPTPELQRVHRQLLRADPQLETPAGKGQTVRLTELLDGPAQLPPAVPHFAGRQHDVARAVSFLRSHSAAVPPVLAVVGAPGSGKSAFACSVAHRVRESFPEGLLYAGLGGMADGRGSISDVLATFLRAAGVLPQDLPAGFEERSRLFRRWLADRRVLIVLDDAVGSRQIGPLLPSSPGSAALVVARRRLSGPAVGELIELRPLGTEDAVALLAALLGDDRVAKDRDGARRLARLCGGLPIALRAAAGRLVLRPHWSPRRLVERLQSAPCMLAELSDGEYDVRASIETSYQLLPAPWRRAFCQLGRMPSAVVSIRQAALVLGCTEHEAESVLERLVELLLVEVEPGGADDEFRYRFPVLVRLAAQSLADSATEAAAGMAASLSRVPLARHEIVAGERTSA